MSITRSIAALATAALIAVPSAAFAAPPPNNPGAAHRMAGANPGTHAGDTPGPDASPAAKAKAYGKLCRGESRKHVPGEKGTDFSRCVTAMAKLASREAKTARAACAGLSRAHTPGAHGSPFSRCVAAAARLADQSGRPAGA